MADFRIDSAVAAEAAVRSAASRARLAMAPDDVPAHAAWLRAELDALHGALRGVRLSADGVAVGVGAGGMPLRADGGPPYAMTRGAPLVAPSSRLGWILVPRLAADPVVSRSTPDEFTGVPDLLADDAFNAELESGA